MIRWPWKRHAVPNPDSRLAVEAAQRAFYETQARAKTVDQVTQQAKKRAWEAKQQKAANHLAPTIRAAFELSRKRGGQE